MFDTVYCICNSHCLAQTVLPSMDKSIHDTMVFEKSMEPITGFVKQYVTVQDSTHCDFVKY